MNIFVAGLSYQITDADLKELFEEYGEVSSAKIISDRETRRSKGYGFVEMATEEDVHYLYLLLVPVQKELVVVAVTVEVTAIATETGINLYRFNEIKTAALRVAVFFMPLF